MPRIKLKFPQRAAGLSRGWVLLTGTITIGAAGAVSSATGDAGTPVKTASETGRYTLTWDRTYRAVRPLGQPGLIGPADTALGNTDGNATCWRNVSTTGADIQTLLASSGADTNTTSGNKLTWAVYAQEQ